jgi:hypothetical protein
MWSLNFTCSEVMDFLIVNFVQAQIAFDAATHTHTQIMMIAVVIVHAASVM